MRTFLELLKLSMSEVLDLFCWPSPPQIRQLTYCLSYYCSVVDTFSDINDDAKEEMEKDFTKTFDKDNNGKLDKNEMKSWLFPDDDFSTEEPKALIKEADDDKDGKLSMDEIMKNYKVFIEDADSDHDEL